jgi:hypothetical protein
MLCSTKASKHIAGVISVRKFGGFVSQSTIPLNLAAAENIADESFARPKVWLRRCGRCNSGGNDGPAAANPVRVASVYQFVGTASEATIWRIL